MTPFERALRERIKAEGPISVEAFMDACNAYYYATRDPIGARGDFTTAPEISQMFGELIGAALATCWIEAGRPENAVYAELGPGRGTLAADALNVMRRVGFSGAVHLVETSPTMRREQESRLGQVIWHDRIDDLPSVPMLLVANEFLDVLPIRQFIEGIERCVTITAGELAFDRDGHLVEVSPARNAAVAAIAERLVAAGGAAVIIDYGHLQSACGETLQAVHQHSYASVLARPGEQDLTAHVDFEAVAKVAASCGAAVTAAIPQGEWLEGLGIGTRAAKLAASNPARAAELELARHRLCDPDQMGELFKIIGIHAPQWPAPAGFE